MDPSDAQPPQVTNGADHIGLFADSLVECARASSYASEIKAQRGDVLFLVGGDDGRHHRIEHVAAEKRVWMGNDRTRRRITGLIQSFDLQFTGSKMDGVFVHG
jgi:hypothetical protein